MFESSPLDATGEQPQSKGSVGMAKASKKPRIADVKDVPTEADMKRGDEILKRMLQTKPKPHKDMVGKTGGKAGDRSGAKAGKPQGGR